MSIEGSKRELIELKLFEVQELRHTDRPYDFKLQEIDEIIESTNESDQSNEFGDIIDEINQLRSHSKDKNWQIIYKSTSNQAKFMMNSLDKSFNFVEQLLDKPNSPQFDEIYSSFKVKCNYYIPSIQRVLNILSKSITQGFNINGDCLRDHADLQQRWKTLDNKLEEIDSKLIQIKHSNDFDILNDKLALLNLQTPSKPQSRPSSRLSHSRPPSRLPRPSTPSRPYSPTPSIPSNSSTPSRIPRSSRSSSLLSADIGRGRNLLTPEPTLRANARPFWGASNSPIPRSRRVVSGRSSILSSSTSSKNEDSGNYLPNSIDPLDVQVGIIYNDHGLGIGIQRIDPPLSRRPRPETVSNMQAQYAFETPHNRKVVNCKLLEVKATRRAQLNGEGDRKKVMVRVGGGWKDLSHYLIERQQ
ncbi:hypothetical protein E3P86_02210 [Wallemia ichthyophaga]|uniref:GAR domain-containing protein n=1 Tax=Wallemia ichthyophaga TaxID=245174 RepID=A0A4T0J4J8_WALIC|nr:hypothetical protein E3P86_02210 [Wallemia ichthyophaga]